MRKFRPQFCFFVLVFAAAITLACGSSAHVPQSVAVNPATANAASFPSGQVQFTATAYYSTKPSPVTPAPATWSVCSDTGIPTTNDVSVATSGLAQCMAGASGRYTIYAFIPDPDFKGVCVDPACGTGSCGGVAGTAQLTCP